MSEETMNVHTLGGLLRLSWLKSWMLHRGVLMDYAAVAAVTVALLGGDGPIGFAIVGALVACSMGARVGGDQTLAGTWEFTLTRPVNRGRWFDANFLGGLLPVGALLVMFAVSDLIGLSARVGALLADPLPDASHASGIALAEYALPVSFVLLVYAYSFQFSVRERAAANVLAHRASGLIAAGFTLFACVVAASLLTSSPFGTDDPHRLVPLSAPILGVAGAAFLIGRTAVIRREELGRGEPGTALRTGPATSLTVVMVVIALVLVFLWCLLAPSDVVPTADPTTTTTTPTEGGR